jgi:glycosyltransferase involved in cell wall biosynthesis
VRPCTSRAPCPASYDALLVTDLLSLADLKALWAGDCPPALAYFHENQLTYPLAPGEKLDLQYGFTDITTCLAADLVRFNSRTHLDAFARSLPRFLKHMPEYRPSWVVGAIRQKSAVLYPGCRFDPGGEPDLPRPGEAPLVVWNHRWEFDKNPELFFRVLERAAAAGAGFRLALLGENFQTLPRAFVRARERLGERILRYGYVESREEYCRWLRRGAVVVSTAEQENFGISVVEAVRHGCAPLLPRRLSYPELIPRELHRHFLYRDEEDLLGKLLVLLRELPRPGNRWTARIAAASRAMGRFSWRLRIEEFDRELERLCESRACRWGNESRSRDR